MPTHLAQGPAGPSLSATAPVDAAQSLAAEVDGLADLDLHALRHRWRQRLRSAPPSTLPRPLLLRLLAYRLQARVHGDLDAKTGATLDRLARDHARRREAGEKPQPKAPPPVPPASRERGLKPGTLLVRQHGGEQHRVVVVAGGYLWQGRTFASLSEAARAITGTRWNGPRFFGLRGPPAGRRDSEAP